MIQNIRGLAKLKDKFTEAGRLSLAHNLLKLKAALHAKNEGAKRKSTV